MENSYIKTTIPLFFVASLTVWLTACHTPHSSDQAMHSFECTNGEEVRVRYLDTDRIEINVGTHRAILSSAEAASGERYVSKTDSFAERFEWHQKGNEALFNVEVPGIPKMKTRTTTCRQR